MDLSTLSPEERATLREALGQEEQDPMAQLSAVLELFASKLEALEERQGKLESVVVDEIIGGISNLYNDNMRVEGIKGLKGKYGDLFGPNEGAFKDLYDGADVYEKLFDMIEGMKKGEGFTDEAGDTEIKRIAGELSAKISKLKAPEVAGEPVAAAIEVKSESDPLDSLKEGILKMKKRGRVPGMMGEPRMKE